MSLLMFCQKHNYIVGEIEQNVYGQIMFCSFYLKRKTNPKEVF